MTFQVDDEGAVGLPPALREVVHPDDPRQAGRQSRGCPNDPEEGARTAREPKPVRETRAGFLTEAKPTSRSDW